MAMAADVPAGVQLAEKQTLVRNSGAEPQSLDPNKIEGVPEANISRDLFEGLLNTSPKDGHPIPGVAESWDNKDFKVWTFHLRKDAKWSNGEPVTAQDFVYSWQRLVDPKTASPYASYPQYGHIVNVDEIIDGKKAPSELGVKPLTTTRWKSPSANRYPIFINCWLTRRCLPSTNRPSKNLAKVDAAWQYRYQRRVYSERLGGQRADRNGSVTRTIGIMLKPSLTPLPGCRPLPK